MIPMMLAAAALACFTTKQSKMVPLIPIVLTARSIASKLNPRETILLWHASHKASKKRSYQESIDESCGIGLHCLESWCDLLGPQLV